MFYEVIPGREVGRIEGALTYFYNGALLPGTVVEIMVGRKKASGVVVKKVAQPEFKCKPIGRILCSKPLPMHLIKTAKWISEYYLAPVSACMGMMLPVGVLKQRRGRKTEQMFGKNNVTGPVASSSPKIFAKQEILGVTLRTHHPSPVHDRLDSAPLRTHQLLPVHDESMPIPLNPHQKNALKGLQEAVGATTLLHGVTGSGKTNIYLTMAVNALKRQKSVVLLVPEIALTGQLVRVFQEVFGDRITLIHSRQTEVERHQIFDSLLLTEEPQIVIGPRSALFAPLDNLGLIIIDEEHEST